MKLIYAKVLKKGLTKETDGRMKRLKGVKKRNNYGKQTKLIQL